jgi:hypothetical protein
MQTYKKMEKYVFTSINNFLSERYEFLEESRIDRFTQIKSNDLCRQSMSSVRRFLRRRRKVDVNMAPKRVRDSLFHR